MTTHVHILCYNEEEILPFTLRHYRTFADRIVVHDSFSTDRSRDIAKALGVEVVDWDTGDALNDELARKLKAECWHGTMPDWCIAVDADELIYFPEGAARCLREYRAQGLPAVRPYGFEMYADVFPTGEGQLYDEVKMGAPDNYWYAKPALYAPKLIQSIEYEAGAHHVRILLKNGRVWTDRAVGYAKPHTYLLHCKHLGPIERDIARYTRQRQRLSELNVQRKWGNFEPPEKHARDKRHAILRCLQRVIA